MIWLFASAVLLLLVFHPGFRKFALWLGGVAGALGVVGLGLMWLNRSHQQSAEAYLDSMTCTYGRKMPSGDCPPAPDISDLAVPPLGRKGAVSATNSCAPGVVHSADDTRCFDVSSAVIVCEAWQHAAKDSRTGRQSCYDPHDALQLAEHLKECAPPKPGDPYYLAKVVADRRSVPCNPYDQFDNNCPAPPATPWLGCVTRDSKLWTRYTKANANVPVTASTRIVTEPGIVKKLNGAPDCPAGQLAVTPNVGTPWSCYDPLLRRSWSST